MSHESHKRVSAFDAKTHLSSLIREVEGGQSFTITRRGSPVARLEPVNRQGEEVHELLARFRAVRQRVKGKLINSMNGNHESRIADPRVDHLINSDAIASDSRLGLGDSESHELPSKTDQYPLKGAGDIRELIDEGRKY